MYQHLAFKGTPNQLIINMKPCHKSAQGTQKKVCVCVCVGGECYMCEELKVRIIINRIEGRALVAQGSFQFL